MSELDVSKCEHYYEYPVNDIECNTALEGDNCKKVCHNKNCKWSLCSENEYCEYKVNWYIQQLKIENKKLKQKLEKIKEISNIIIYGTHFTSDIEGHLKELVKDILQIIESEN